MTSNATDMSSMLSCRLAGLDGETCAILCARYAAEDTDVRMTSDGAANADVTSDGKVAAYDTVMIAQYIARLITEFPW